jgi:NADP-dependent 3-hydroxy acid dehydrogenase YdfG
MAQRRHCTSERTEEEFCARRQRWSGWFCHSLPLSRPNYSRSAISIAVDASATAIRFHEEVTKMSAIKGKVVAITGASSGIGEAAGRLLAASGAKVLLGARRFDRLEAIAADIRKNKGEVDLQAIDVSKREDLASFVKKAQDRFGRLDVLISNAGLMPLSSFDELKVDEWDRMIDVNIKGVLYGIAAALPVFRKQGSGHFINVSSVAGHRVAPTGAVYSGTKFAVRAISEGLRQEAGDKIRVTIISPGAVESELAETISNPDVKKRIQDYRKMAIPAEAIASAMAYAIGQPSNVDVNEILIRPTAQPN